MNDLSTRDVVLMVHVFRVPPVKVVHRMAIAPIVLEHFRRAMIISTNVHIDVISVVLTTPRDHGRCESLAATRHLAANGRVDDDLPAVGGDDVEVLHGAGLVVFEEPSADVLLFGCQPLGISRDLDGRLLHAGGRLRRVALNIASNENAEHDDRDENCECLLHLFLLFFVSGVTGWCTA